MKLLRTLSRLLLLSAAVMLLAGCTPASTHPVGSGEGEQTALSGQTTQDIAAGEPVFGLVYGVTEHTQTASLQPFSVIGDTLYLRRYEGNGTDAVCILDEIAQDGSSAASHTVPRIQADEVLQKEASVPEYAALLPDGSFLAVYKTEQSLQFRVLSADGAVLAAAEQKNRGTAAEYTISVGEDGDVRLLYNDQINLYCYDEALALRGVMQTPGMNITAAYLGDDCYRIGTRADRMRLYDMKTGEITDIPMTVPDTFSGANIYRGADGNDYLSDGSALYRYHEGEEPVCVLRWAEAGLSAFNPLEDTLFIVHDRFFAVASAEAAQPGLSSSRLYTVSAELQQMEARIPLEVSVYLPSGTSVEFIDRAAAAFNRENDTYRASVAYYSTTDSGSGITNMISETLLLGDTPDLIISASNTALQTLSDKQAWLDLSSTVSGKVSDNILTAYRIADGAVPYIPLGYTCAALAMPSAQQMPLTWDNVYALAASLGEGDVLIGDTTAASAWYSAACADYFSREDGSSSFDTEEFREMIRFLDGMDAVTDPTAGEIRFFRFTAQQTQYYMTMPSMRKNLAEGTLQMVSAYIGTPQAYMALIQLFGETPFTLHGYPGTDGEYTVISGDYYTAIPAGTGQEDGACAFLSCLLSDAVQTEASLTATLLPVTESALRLHLENNRVFYYQNRKMEEILAPTAVASYDVFTGNVLYLSSQGTDLTADFTSAALLAEYADGAAGDYTAVTLTDDTLDALISFLQNTPVREPADQTVQSIVDEELSAWNGGARTLEETTKIIDSRVWIYINE